MILIIAKQIVKKDKVDEFIKLTKPLIEGSNNEAGCIEYILYRDQKENNILTFVEKWKDADAIKAHQEAKHYVEIVPTLKALIDGAEVTHHDPL